MGNVTSPTGRAMIASFEGLRLTAYQDIVGVWTIGYGHTGPDVKPGLAITRQQADQLLVNDLARFERGVNALLPPDFDCAADNGAAGGAQPPSRQPSLPAGSRPILD